jgi:predicted Zn-dependent protease
VRLLRAVLIATLCAAPAADAGARTHPQAGASLLDNAAQGYALVVPEGWEPFTNPDGTSGIRIRGNPSVSVVVRVAKHAAPVSVDKTLADYLAVLFNDRGRTMVSQAIDVYAGRAALMADLQDASTRWRVMMVARDSGATSQVFYVVVAQSPTSAFTNPGQVLVRVTNGFRVTSEAAGAAATNERPAAKPAPAPPPARPAPTPPVSPSAAPAATAPPPPSAPPSAPPAPAPRVPAFEPPPRTSPPPAPAIDRAAAYERYLAPRPAVDAAAAASPGKDAKSRADAALAYDRGFAFAQQAAWAEAEKEFRNAEKKDGDNVEHLMALGWVYNKLHRPDDARKRYDKVYKKDPRALRALVGLAASYEEFQNYREAVIIWQRFIRAAADPAERAGGAAMLRGAQDLFVQWYEIAENPAGGAKNLMSSADEANWGRQVASQLIESGLPELTDELTVEYVRGLCDTILAVAKNVPDKPRTFVLDNSTVNAMTTPGFIFVFRGLLGVVDSEAELAGVLAHEIAHSIAHHGAKEKSKAYADQQQLEQLKASSSRLSQFLAKLIEAGNPYGQLSFSRENESQADRLAVHLLYDAGYDPRGFATFFKKLESLDPSSRKSWDLMQRTHPFSIDRLNAINEYAALFPEKPVQRTSPAFGRLKSHLATLPPPVEGAEAAPSSGASPAATTPFTLDAVPFAGEIPAGWGARNTPSGTIVFEGPKGTESYEVSIEFGAEPKRQGLSIDQLAEMIEDVLAKKPQAAVQPAERETAQDGTPIRIIKAAYRLQGQGGMVPLKHVTVLLDYPGYYTILSYYTPEAIYQKYSDTFTAFLKALRYTGR